MLDAVNKPQILQHACKSLNITIYDCKWIPYSARFVVLGAHPRSTGSLQASLKSCCSTLYSALQVFELEGADVALQAESEKPSGLKCGTFGAASPADRLLATGDLNGRLSLWDLEALDEPVDQVEAHSGTVNAIDGCGGKCDGHGPPEVATCGQDGCVRVFDVRQIHSPVASFEPTPGSNKRECWSVAFGDSYNDTERCLLAGYENGDLKLFDLHMNQIRWEANVKNGICGVQFDRQDIAMNKFVVACLESQVHVFDARTQHPTKASSPLKVASLKDTVQGFAKMTMTTEFKSTCWAPKHLPQNRELVAVTHGDGTIALFKYRYPPQRKRKDADGKYEGVAGSLESLSHNNFSSQPISCFDWSPDKQGLFVSGALDQCIRVGLVTKLNKI